MSRRAKLISAALLVLILIVLVRSGWLLALSDPVVRHAAVRTPAWPEGAAPVRAILISDLHLCAASMPAQRRVRINRQLRELAPDLVLIAGDIAAGADRAAARCAAARVGSILAGLEPRLGIVAVLGNHDNYSGPAVVGKALRREGASVVENTAVRRGPLIIAVSGDTSSGHARLGGALIAAARLERQAPGVRIYLSHSPDIARWLPPGPALLLAGHTHCGQIVLPIVSSLHKVSKVFGNRLRCGVKRIGGTTVIVSGGLGTSNVPLRIAAPPDLWLITFGPSDRRD